MLFILKTLRVMSFESRFSVYWPLEYKCSLAASVFSQYISFLDLLMDQILPRQIVPLVLRHSFPCLSYDLHNHRLVRIPLALWPARQCNAMQCGAGGSQPAGLFTYVLCGLHRTSHLRLRPIPVNALGAIVDTPEPIRCQYAIYASESHPFWAETVSAK